MDRGHGLCQDAVQVSDALHSVEDFQSASSPQHVAIAVESGAESVTADAAQLNAALRALAKNGLEAAVSIGQLLPRLCMSALRGTHGGKSGVLIVVEDNGPGFIQGTREQAMDPFFSTKEARSGLGLAIAKRFAEAHGGALLLGTSAVLGGAEVRIFLPDDGFGIGHTHKPQQGYLPT